MTGIEARQAGISAELVVSFPFPGRSGIFFLLLSSLSSPLLLFSSSPLLLVPPHMSRLRPLCSLVAKSSLLVLYFYCARGFLSLFWLYVSERLAA
jgi:hypothetical protein